MNCGFFSSYFSGEGKCNSSQSSFRHPNFLGVNQWNVLVKKWKLQRTSYCHILICFVASLLQTFTWNHTTIPGEFFALGYFRHALYWIHQSGLPMERIFIWNVRKGSIDFNCWVPSVKHIIARDIAFLTCPFT